MTIDGGFADPITAGGILVQPGIQSPNFSLIGQTGWAILANGNAFFFNITASGTITATTFDGTNFVISPAGAFFYSATPLASGNLIASIASAGGTDGFGNVYLAGVASYAQQSPLFWSAAVLTGGELVEYSATSEAGPWGVVSVFSTTNTADGTILSATGVLTLIGTVVQLGEPLTVSMAAAAGGLLTVTNSTAAPTTSNVQIQSAAATDNAWGIRVTGDPNNRMRIDTNGEIHWGPGSAALDTDLFRAGACSLKTDGSLTAGTLAFGTGVATLTTDASGYPVATDGQGLALNVSGSALSSVNTPTVTTTGVKSLGFLAIAQNDVETGCAYTIHASGQFGTGTTPSSATFTVFWGGIAGTNIGSLAVPTITAGLSNAAWICDAEIDWTSTTACEVALILRWKTGAGVTGSAQWHVVAVTTGLTTTSAQNLSLGFAWGSVPAGTTLSCDVCRVGRAA